MNLLLLEVAFTRLLHLMVYLILEGVFCSYSGLRIFRITALRSVCGLDRSHIVSYREFSEAGGK